MNLRRWTLVATLFLGMLALASWCMTSFLAVYGNWQSHTEAQVPAAVSFSVAACLGWVLLVVLEKRRDSETRCRQCGHILRGLSEPRCPECGEKI